ncbi:MAG TPA: EamA family transporter [Thermoanaerobaculia bacterium]|nr:EamA family transporter [Thermoanaerobaculia bacterium]
MKHDRSLAALAFVIVCIVWGTTYLGIRIAVETIPPLLLTGIRYTIAGMVMLPLLLLRGERIPRDRRTLGNIAIVALLLIAGGNLALVWAEQWVPSGLASLLVAVGPFWATSIEALRRDGERISLRQAVGMAIGFGGVAMLVTPHGAGGAFDSRFIAGALIILAGAIAWQGGSVHAKHALKDKVSPLLSAALQSLFAGVVLTVTGLAAGEAPRFHPSTRSLIALAYLTLFGSIIAYSAYTYALSKIRVSTMSLYAYINPVVAVLLGWLVLKETLTPASIAAMAIILAGVAVVQTSPRGSAAVVQSRTRTHPLTTRGDCSGTPRSSTFSASAANVSARRLTGTV